MSSMSGVRMGDTLSHASVESGTTGLGAGEGPDDASQEVLDQIRAVAETEAQANEEHAFGRRGRPIDRRAPFYIGFAGAIGVACAFALAYIIVVAGQILVLLGLSFFLAVGLDPAVRWLYRHGLPRWLATTFVLIGALGALAGLLFLAVPIIVTEAGHFADNVPHYLRSLNSGHGTLGRLNAKYHLISGLQNVLRGQRSSFGTVLGVGKVVLGFLTALTIVITVTIYLLVDLPRVKRGIYQLAPKSRRARMVLLTDEILDRVGGYVLGNLFASLVAGVLTWAWAAAFSIPYALLLAVFVAIVDLIPIIGSTIGGIVVALVALTVSVPVAIATAIYYFIYRFLEDYLLLPRIMERTVEVPGLVTVVATVLGGALLGIIGALVAIPIAAAIKLLMEEIVAPSLDER